MAMRMCDGCGVEKDMGVAEVYPYGDEDGIVSDRGVVPLFRVDVAPDTEAGVWRHAWLCHECFHHMDVDMWIAERHWGGMVPFELLEAAAVGRNTL